MSVSKSVCCDNHQFVIVVGSDMSVCFSHFSPVWGVQRGILSMQSLGRRWITKVQLVKKYLTLQPHNHFGSSLCAYKSLKGNLPRNVHIWGSLQTRSKISFCSLSASWKHKLPVNFQFLSEFFESWMLFDNFTCCLFVTQWPLRKGDNSGYGTNWKSPGPLPSTQFWFNKIQS